MSCLLILDKCALGLMNVLLHFYFSMVPCITLEKCLLLNIRFMTGGTKRWDTSVTSILEGHCLLVTIVLGRDK